MNRRHVRVYNALTVGTGAYTAGDVVGGLLTFEVSTENGARSGNIVSVLLTDDHKQSEQYVLYLFDQAPTTIANDAAFAPTIADLKKIIGTVVVATADWTEINNNDWALLGGHEDTRMRIPFVTHDGNVYMYAVATDTPDYNAATDLTITIVVEMDN